LILENKNIPSSSFLSSLFYKVNCCWLIHKKYSGAGFLVVFGTPRASWGAASNIL